MTAATKAATNEAEWTAGWKSSDCSSGEEDVAESLAESVISEFDAAMGKLNEVATTRQVSPLMFQKKLQGMRQKSTRRKHALIRLLRPVVSFVRLLHKRLHRSCLSPVLYLIQRQTMGIYKPTALLRQETLRLKF